MTDNTPNIQAQDQKKEDKEYNFRLIEAKYNQERESRIQAEKRADEAVKAAQEAQSRRPDVEDEEDDDDPYVNKKKLKKTLNQFGEQNKRQTQQDIDKAVNSALQEERKQSWLKQNNDFYDVLQNAQKFADYDPELAEAILQMPEGFERQKLVYKNIKALGLHQDKPKDSIQDKIDANKRTPHYQPSAVGTSPYHGVDSDFSTEGQKRSFDKMKELQKRGRF